MKRPAFPLYAETWLSDADLTVMGASGRAIYLDLLLRCWNDGGIPEPDGSAAGWARLAALGCAGREQLGLDLVLAHAQRLQCRRHIKFRHAEPFSSLQKPGASTGRLHAMR